MGDKKKAKNESIKYFLIVLCITTTLMLVKKSNILETLTNSSSLRNLLDKSKRNYLCDKAGSRLMNKYFSNALNNNNNNVNNNKKNITKKKNENKEKEKEKVNNNKEID